MLRKSAKEKNTAKAVRAISPDHANIVSYPVNALITKATKDTTKAHREHETNIFLILFIYYIVFIARLVFY